MMTMKLWPCLLAIGIAAGSSFVAAQGMGSLLKGLGLGNADYALMEEAGATLYRHEPPEVGSKASWKNPETGAHGTVELTSVEGRCVGLRHLFKLSAQAKTDTVSSRRCRNDAGKWVLSLE
jgi:surface antigen